ncbi:MAG: DUF4331 family protein [Ferruginibacter sp.]|nr:DUF4331 family protein [Chitinophagaceae bacterium]
MKTTIKLIAIALGSTLIVTSCKKKDSTPAPTVYYQQNDQMGRPAINTVFIAPANKDKFNTTPPSAQNAAFASEISAKLTAFGYTSNILGLNNAAFSGVLATDVLTAATVGTTTFYDGTNVLTGRTLADDVINVELILIFGGSTGGSNPGLTNDNVDANDKPFLASFPYLAAPF